MKRCAPATEGRRRLRHFFLVGEQNFKWSNELPANNFVEKLMVRKAQSALKQKYISHTLSYFCFPIYFHRSQSEPKSKFLIVSLG